MPAKVSPTLNPSRECQRRTHTAVTLLILQETVKSAQRHLHEFLAQVASENAYVTPGG